MKLSFDHIPKKNKRVMLCYRCNATCGGTTHSLGHQICTENYKLLVNAAKVLSLDLVGFDVLCEDINVPLHKSKGVIIESNHNPDLSIHEHPMSGPPVKVCEIILKKIIQRKWRSALKYYLKTSPFKKHLYIRAAVVIAAIFVLKGIVNLLN